MMARRGEVRRGECGYGHLATAAFHSRVASGFGLPLVLMILAVAPKAITGAGRRHGELLLPLGREAWLN
jgi:hypothetical protein